MAMDRQSFEAGLKRDGYEILTNTTQGTKMNPEHSHPFDVRAMVIRGAITITSGGEVKTYKPGDTWDLARGCLHSESYGPAGAVVLFGRKM
jgi:quercetin dioxygenase-like cupin family protein